jgi:23S rRNA pseudouridine2457 synthase
VLSKHFGDRLGRDTLATLNVPGDLHPAGRLDFDSEGLLLLTDDGQTLHRLTHPDFSHAKTYLVLVLGRPGDDALARLRQGTKIKLGTTRPADVEVLAGPPPLPPFPNSLPSPEKTSWLRMVLFEGMNRQIKRMTAAVGHPTVRLVRVAVGRVRLTPDLTPGQWRYLTPVERSVLMDDVWPHGRRR